MSPNDGEEALCADCVEHDYFPEIIEREANSHHCNCCGRTASEPIALTIDCVADRLQEGLELEWSDVQHTNAPWDSEDKRYVASTYSTYELLNIVQFYAGCRELHDQVVQALPHREWARNDPLSLREDERLRTSWEEFSDLVKHRHRYLLFPEEERTLPQEIVPPDRMLSELGELLHEINLMRDLGPDCYLYRVRIEEPEETFTGLEEMCSPPAQEAKYSNRMSPAGVSAFYASYDPITAVAETDQADRTDRAVATVGVFSVTEEIPVIDFTDLPSVPSLFSDDPRRYRRRTLRFLHEFVDSLTEPVPKDELEHVEYVPSQVVTEYLRDRFESVVDEVPKGIIYPSATGRECVSLVLFYSHEDFTEDHYDTENPPVELVQTVRWRLRP